MTENLYAADVGSVLSKTVADDVFVANLTAGSIPDVIFGLREADDPPTVNLLARGDVLKAATADFVVASNAADLIADGTLSVRQTDDVAGTPLFVSDDRVVSVVSLPGQVAGLVATDAAFVTEANDHYRARWAAAEQFRPTAPPLSRVRETLASELGKPAVADFDAALEVLPEVRRDGDGLDEVTVCILVAARHGVLLYDVSRWGEDVGLASKATFSRTKGELEDAGLIQTEKVPIDVGRPRLRLRLATHELRSADVPELTRLARERTAAARES